MRRSRLGAAGVVLWILVLLSPLPSLGSDQPLCVPDALTAALDSNPTDSGPAAGGETGYLSFHGATSFVYGSFADCGERTRLRVDNGLELRYSTVRGSDPFERLKSWERDHESFFDAEYELPLDGLGQIGYAASLHTSAAADEVLGDGVAGSRLWFTSANARIQASSELAVSASEASERAGTARRHKLSLVVLDTGDHQLSTGLSFARVDRDFRGRRSSATPDRQIFDATVRLDAGDAALSLSLSSAHDNLGDDPDLVTHRWLTASAEGSYRLSDDPLLPDSVRLYGSLSEARETTRILEDALVGATRVLGLGASWQNWRFGGGAAALGGGVFADWRAGTDRSRQGPTLGGDARLSVDLDRLLAIPGQIATTGGVIGGEGSPFDFGWRWNLAAELDCLDLLFDTASDRGAYMLGRLGSALHEGEAGLVVDYRGMLTAGFRF